MPAVEYDDLSRGRKQEIDLKRRMAAKEARETAARGPDMGMRIGDVLANTLPSPRKEPSVQAVRKQRQLDDKARAAQARADYEDVRDTSGLKLFEDPQASKEAGARAKAKINPARRMEVEGMKKGGVTRADGCITKGHTRGKMV